MRAAVAGYRARGLRRRARRGPVALEAAGVEVEVHGRPTELRPEPESALALALRESVTNVVRHADAQHATILIATAEADVRLEVTDDGRGRSGPEGSGITGCASGSPPSVECGAEREGWTPARDIVA